MTKSGILLIPALLLVSAVLSAGEKPSENDSPPRGNSWSKVLKERSQRGTLRDAYQRVRGDSGKWNDEPSLQIAPAIKQKPAKTSLDDWADQLQKSPKLATTTDGESWLLFKTRQLDDNDRVWIERIERDGTSFTVVLKEAIWQGRYSKTFTYYNVYGVNLGRLAPGDYQAKWLVKPLSFNKFEGNSRPRNPKRQENWPKDDRPAKENAVELSVAFTVVAESK